MSSGIEPSRLAHLGELDKPVDNHRAQMAFHDFYHDGEFDDCMHHGSRTVESLVIEAAAHFAAETELHDKWLAAKPTSNRSEVMAFGGFMAELGRIWVKHHDREQRVK